jgi:mRNA-degrading endonuclease HigB of HigAB toxin-antitoxin module
VSPKEFSEIHYSNHRIYIRRILTHAEYNKGDWKE